MNAQPRGIPLRPDFSARPRASTFLYRAAAAHVLDKARGFQEGAETVARQMFGPDDRETALILKAATVPATIGTAAWAGSLAPQAVADLVIGLSPASAAAALIERGLRLNLSGYASITVPFRLVTAADAGSFVGEGQPIGVRQQNLSAGPTLTPNKLATISTYSRELQKYAVQDMTSVVRANLSDAARLALDSAIFSNTAAVPGVRPAGILNGVSGQVPTAGGGQNAIMTDIANLIGALAGAGAAGDIVFVAPLKQAAALQMWTGPNFTFSVLPSAAVATGTVIAVEVGSFVSAFGPDPDFSIVTEGTLHMDDVPLPIGSVGSPTTVAAPTRSLWQTDSIGLRMILNCSWAMRAPGHAQFVSGVTW